MDLDTKRSDPDGPASEGEEEIKKCTHCGTSKTPLWRGGPAGPKSLCNACGIRNRKKIRVISSGKKSGGSGSTSSSNGSTVTSTMTSTSKIRTVNERLMTVGREAMMGRTRVGKRTPRVRKLGEEEQAAVLLMALSYASVYA